jgi:hypothetical protein
MNRNDLLDELLKIEHGGWQALSNATGDKFYGSIMTDDALMVLADGSVMDRDAVVNALDQAPPWARYEIAEPRVVAVDDDTAALVYLGTGYRDGADEPFVGAMSSVYHRTSEGWRLALYQQTATAGR